MVFYPRYILFMLINGQFKGRHGKVQKERPRIFSQAFHLLLHQEIAPLNGKIYCLPANRRLTPPIAFMVACG